MANWLLNSDGDLDFSTGNYTKVTGVEAIAQDCETRLRTFLGEWFLDTRIGVPYYQDILGQKPRIPVVRNIFRKAVLTTPGVINVTDLNVTYDGATRELSVSFIGETTEGTFTFDKELIV